MGFGRGKLKSRAVQMSMMSDKSRQSLQDEDAVFSRPLVQRHPHTGEELLRLHLRTLHTVVSAPQSYLVLET